MSMEHGKLREQHGIVIHAASIWYPPWSNINITQKGNTLGSLCCAHTFEVHCTAFAFETAQHCQIVCEWVNSNFHEFPMMFLEIESFGRIIWYWEYSKYYWILVHCSVCHIGLLHDHTEAFSSPLKPCGQSMPKQRASWATHPSHPSLLHLAAAIVIETSVGHNCIQGPESKQELPKPGTSSSLSTTRNHLKWGTKRKRTCQKKRSLEGIYSKCFLKIHVA